jgi:hypothetical protein
MLASRSWLKRSRRKDDRRIARRLQGALAGEVLLLQSIET